MCLQCRTHGSRDRTLEKALGPDLGTGRTRTPSASVQVLQGRTDGVASSRASETPSVPNVEINRPDLTFAYCKVQGRTEILDQMYYDSRYISLYATRPAPGASTFEGEPTSAEPRSRSAEGRRARPRTRLAARGACGVRLRPTWLMIAVMSVLRIYTDCVLCNAM